ncbi:MAG: hypothetical protein PHR82_07820 [Endomicrobiaceae bacterium]|nr:hypothetical protein [Endomicrobiaceae bacterium]
MDDLISRSALLSKKFGIYDYFDDESSPLAEPHFTGRYAVSENDIVTSPAVDAAPVRHGEWIDTGEDDGNGNYLFHCSSCGYSDAHSKSVEVPYCWHCGARMDG